ncbi:IPT/TIG domain-containing protein [Gloeobacter morelensis]|uniref:IPT/TIG domain-containing protein n=1 Tax=Gloeobacter morelensis MG652769 TaxID=2781736 RepID=A0ABY3PP75_9CYAN|nr:IPT/TIG domain-containing protein [Gloeobacter morelensis]UFP95425.1 IPT/TIG domain-containing protein [Gloeobacter morelensis MG652769]
MNPLYIRLLVIFALLVPLGLQCRFVEQGAAFAAAGAITGFSPASGSQGTEVVIEGSGFNNVSSVKIGGGSLSYKRNSDTKITATVTSNAQTGSITVQTAEGLLTSASAFTVIEPAPTITSFSPTSGPPGTKIIIQGSDFNNVQSVKVGSVYLAYSRDSETQITATTATGKLDGKITVTTPNGSATSSGTFTSDPPSVTGFSPTSGTAQPKTQVAINGVNLLGVTSVTFGDNDGFAQFTLPSPSQIQADVPCTARSGKIGVSTAEGVVYSSGSFTVPDTGVPEEVPTRIACLWTPAAPDGWTSAQWWGQAIYDNDQSGEASLEIDYVQLWCKVDGVDTKLIDDQGSAAGGLYVRYPWYEGAPEHDPLPTEYNASSDSLKLNISNHPHKIWQIWGTGARPSFSSSAVVNDCRIKARFKVSGPALVQWGADWWIDATAQRGEVLENNRGMMRTNWYFSSSNWYEVSYP